MHETLRVVCIVLSFVACGCGTTATILMRDGREVGGEIVASDSSTITVAAQEVWCPWSLAKAEADEVRASGITAEHVCVCSVTDVDRLEGAPRSNLGDTRRCPCR